MSACKSVGALDIHVDQGADFTRTIELIDSHNNFVSLTGSTALSEIRPTYSSSTILANLTWTVAMDGLSATLTMSHTVTAAIPVTAATDYRKQTTKYSWDCVLTFGSGEVRRILEGTAIISPSVAR